MIELTSDSGVTIRYSESKLAAGGFCTVSEVERFGTVERPGFVIKRLKHDSGKENSVKRFGEEIRLLEKLKALKSVPDIVESDRGGRRPWYVMRKYSRLSVRDYGDAVRIIINLATVLKHVHNAGIAHKDVKIGNVLLDDDGDVVLCDFGIAVDEETPEELLFYGSPFRRFDIPDEMTRPVVAGMNVDRRRIIEMYQASDVYMLGWCAYHILTRDFQGKSVPPADYLSFEQSIRSMNDLRGECLSITILYKIILEAMNSDYRKRCSLDSFIDAAQKAGLADVRKDAELLTVAQQIKLESIVLGSVKNAEYIVYSHERSGVEIDTMLRIVLNGALLMCRGEFVTVNDYEVRNGIVTIFSGNDSFDFGVKKLAVYQKKDGLFCLITTFELQHASSYETPLLFPSLRSSFAEAGLKIAVFNPSDCDIYKAGKIEELLRKYRMIVET